LVGYEAKGLKIPTFEGYRTNNVATIWKNGVVQDLTDGTNDAQAMCIFVK
jgi:hypothetical protein